ncbi:MAG: lipoyl domain-containing protein [bacterium]|nr:lipoyl domain-containing protein [bacterium]
MAHEVFIPKTGIYMDDCHLIAWLVDEGATVRTGDALFLMETNKVEMEIEAGAGGIVHHGAPVGEDYPIGRVIGWIAEDDSEYRRLVEEGTSA